MFYERTSLVWQAYNWPTIGNNRGAKLHFSRNAGLMAVRTAYGLSGVLSKPAATARCGARSGALLVVPPAVSTHTRTWF